MSPPGFFKSRTYISVCTMALHTSKFPSLWSQVREPGEQGNSCPCRLAEPWGQPVSPKNSLGHVTYCKAGAACALKRLSNTGLGLWTEKSSAGGRSSQLTEAKITAACRPLAKRGLQTWQAGGNPDHTMLRASPLGGRYSKAAAHAQQPRLEGE